MANPKKLSTSGANQAARDNGYDDEHDFKNSLGHGRSETDMCVDIDTNEIILRSTRDQDREVPTGMYTTAR